MFSSVLRLFRQTPVRVLLVLAGVILSQTAAFAATCGDRKCEGTETPKTCPYDCGPFSAFYSMVDDTNKDKIDFYTGKVAGQIEDGVTVWEAIATFINYLLGLIGIVTFFYALYGGVLILSSSGDGEKITEARKILVNAVAGGVVIMVAFALNAWIFKAGFWTV